VSSSSVSASSGSTNSSNHDTQYDAISMALSFNNDEQDPSVGNGYRLYYEKEVPFEVRYSAKQLSGKNVGNNTSPVYSNAGSNPTNLSSQGVMEHLKVKILLLGAEDSPRAVRMELSSETDLFFHFMHVIEEKTYASIQEDQRLVVEFSDYPTVLIRMLNACIKEPQIYLAIFSLLDAQSLNTDARIDFIQNMEYKYVELLYCACVRSPHEVVQHHITYRYNDMKQKLSLARSRLLELNNLVKLKNPSLLLQMQKSIVSGSSLNGHNNNNAIGNITSQNIARLGK